MGSTPIRRNEAGAYAWQRHTQLLMPYVVGFSVLFLAYIAVVVLAIVGLVSLWMPLALTPLAGLGFLYTEKVTNRIDAGWGDGARGEIQVGRELERLYREGFYVFHDWDSGQGNVDHFVVGPQGIFAVETKSWRGNISANGKRLLRDGVPLTRKCPLKQARGEARQIHDKVREHCGLAAYVTPILCFSRATVSCYRPVNGVEVVGLGALNRTIANRPEKYSVQEVKLIAYQLRKYLGIEPAANPTFPPAGPTRKSKVINRLADLSYSTVILAILGGVFLTSLLLPAYFAEAFSSFSGIYRALSALYASLLS
jgi:hypothetical protein